MSETVNKVAVLSSAVKHALLADVQYYDFHASSAFNRKMKGIITPGFYGGFEPALAGGLNLKITSLQGPSGHGVASVDVNNHQITVQQIEDVTLAIPVNGVTRVMLEANYQYGVKTSQVDDSSDIHAARIFTANISVPLADNHLEICRVTVPADATELTLDMIDSSHRRNKALGITLSSEIDSDADHIGASSHAVKKAVKAARDETEKQIEELVDNAPASLDTLKKIADAINNDPDFFNTLNAVLALKAPLHDPALTGIATVPTPPLSVSNKQIANTEYVQAAVAALVGSSPEALDTLAELADALGNDPNFATTMLNKLAGKQPLHEVLTSLSGLNSAANKLAFFNGPNSMALANLTAVGRVLIGQESVAKVLEYLGLVETINRAAGAVQKSGDHMTGGLTFDNDSILAWVRNTDFAKIGFKNESDSDADSYMWFETGDNGDEYFKWRTVAGNTTKDLMTLKLGLLNVLVDAVINGSLGIGTTNALGGNSIALGDNDTGFKQNGDGVLDAYSNSRQVMRIVPSGVQVFGSTGSWIYMRDQTCFSSVAPVDKDGASAIVRQEHPDRHFILGGLGNRQFGIYMINKSRSENGTDGGAFLDENGNWRCSGQIAPGNYANFDARYQPKDNYATQAWVLQNFVQNIRQSGVAYIGAEENSGQRLVPAGGVLIGSQVNGKWDNNEGFYYTWIQQNINGNWLTIGRV
ncbi:phage tail protein (plasmid) [Citrobacter freundii]|uniref:phage tail protein n=2 Tax=Citrobacter freundii TaxID=546 RepID=UPI0025B65068|nr:phage tail protein [Citrobacter freundii]WJZ49570.1 phage tail protein [Citrobacter freundii]